jgi:hypothetical protein
MMPANTYPPLRFQDRDTRILHAIQEYGGVLAKRQVQSIFWPGKSKRAMQNRLSKLKGSQYIAWPSWEQKKLFPIPEPIVWLDWKGALLLANSANFKVFEPKTINENQLRLFERALHAKGFRWLREPHWNQLNHDLTTVDIRLKFEKDIQDINHLKVDQWINESIFRSNMDRVTFSYTDTQGQLRQGKRGVIPDGFLCIADQKRQSQGLPAKANFLLEVDMATHSNPNFSIEKAAAGAAYINSKEFNSRFGSNSGRWLIITTSEVRMQHLMKHTHERIATKSSLFLFTTLPEFFSKNVISEAIWSVCGNNRKQKLLAE